MLEKNQDVQVVRDLIYEFRGYYIRCNNFFTSYYLEQSLLKQNDTMLGSMRKNIPGLPGQMTNGFI